MIDFEKISAILEHVEKPARYTGGELNISHKNPDLPLHLLYAFPDVYEVGMSNLGLAILYNLANEREDTCCERVYAPFPDMQEQMKQAGIPLYSLETYTPAAEFDMIGFSLAYEMCYTTVLSMLKLAGIPLRAENRGEEYPIIFAGGTCTYNAEPLAPFMDLFVIGEGEDVNNELFDLYLEHKNKGFVKADFLKAAAQIPGIYVPSLYDVKYNEDGTVASIDGPIVEKRYVDSLEKAYFPKKLIVPYMGIVHDRVTLEIMRGCTRGCRFCQAGFVYRPVREREKDTVKKQAHELIGCTGFDEMTLSSLSSGDYSQIGPLAIELLDEFETQGVSISLPSLRIDSFDSDYAKRMQSARKTNYTFAPEAGTQRMRDVINKNVTEEDLLRTARYAFESGATGIKLYFMIGLPTETYEDLDGIADLAKKVISVYHETPKELRKGALNLHISTSSFVPKAFTPFQWEAMDPPEVLREKQEYLREKLKMKYVRYNWHDVKTSFLEGVFARGDRRLADVLEYAVEHGCQFDSWQDHFSNDVWMEAFEQTGVDPKFYANRERGLDEVLPYDHISCLVTKEFLLEELEQSRRAATTPDCRQGCNGCGFERWCSKQ